MTKRGKLSDSSIKYIPAYLLQAIEYKAQLSAIKMKR